MRFAWEGLKNTGKFLVNNAGSSTGEIALRIVPDVGFGVLAATQTPGDLGDKLIAGASTGGASILGGIGAAGAVRKIAPNAQALQNLADMGGSIAGDFAGMSIGDMAMRGKDAMSGGAGQTPWERMGAEDQARFAQDLEQQVLAQYGIIPGTREQYAIDPSSGMGVA